MAACDARPRAQRCRCELRAEWRRAVTRHAISSAPATMMCSIANRATAICNADKVIGVWTASDASARSTS